ncbi:MAG TPA: AraC family transcriptional regulator [Blastocatellia bacterium]|jgi:AraC-like DNA-binding protein|nr:AraC family transcriptional regulator [Blastocatellia bacterium]
MLGAMVVLLKPRLTRQDAAEQSETLGGFSFIISETARRHHWSGAGCLSIKSFHGGEALYDVGRGRYRVGSNSYLILNQSQPYEITVDSEKALASFCVFFESGFAEEVNYGLITPAAKLLENPRPARVEPVCFFEKTYPHDDILSPALFRFKAALQDRKDDEVWINERLHELIGQLLQVHRGVFQEVESLPAMRASTREELYRRIHRAKEFIAASFEEPITIDEMAGVACLSTNHFLRTFRQAFRQTPHQFLTAQRLERARKLLLHTDLSVTDVCLSVGFESLGSFSSLFRREMGASPEQFRRAKR